MEEDKGKDRKEEYKERLRAKLRELEARIDELADWARDAEADFRAGVLSDDSALKQKLAEARVRIQELKAASEDGWGEVKAGAQKICADVRAAWDRGRESESDPPSGSGEPSPGGESRAAPDTTEPAG